MALSLDRIAIEEVGANPVRLAEAILKQLPDQTGAVPVHEIAYALDIKDIHEKRVTTFEGCLLTDANKSEGEILLNLNSSPRRRRYTLGHELCHFLSERHVPTTDEGFLCTQADMVAPRRKGQHLEQEREANRFAIELLAPRQRVRHRLARAADLEHALAIADDMDISREAAVRRYVAFHAECLAAVFSHEGIIRYIEKDEEFPATCVWNGEAVPPSTHQFWNSDLSGLDEVVPETWLSKSRGRGLFQQTLRQESGYAIILLMVEDINDVD